MMGFRKKTYLVSMAVLSLGTIMGMLNARVIAEQSRHDVLPLLEIVMANAGPGPQTPEKATAYEKLHAIPTEQLLSQLAPLMRDDARFTEVGSTWKWVGYRLLVRHEAEKYEQGRQLLIDGLSEQSDSIQRMCLGQLALLPPGEYPETSRAVQKLWDAARIEQLPRASTWPDDEYTKLRSSILAAGLATGVVDRDSGLQLQLGIIENQSLPGFFRRAAAGPVLTQLGHQKGLDYFKDADAVIVVGLLNELAHDAAKSNWTFGGDREKQSAAREFVLAQMRHDDAAVRRAALGALVRVFGKDWVVVRSRTDYQINSTVRSAIERMAKDDTDKELRGQAESKLDELESKVGRAAEKVLRDRKVNKEE